MSNINKQELREAAVRAGGGKWIYIRTLPISSAYITEETGATVINCTAGDVPAKCAGFLELANPATVLALLDELEAAEKRIAEQRETLLAARSHVMQCARLGDAHANGVLHAIDRAAAGKGE